jgi:hypothetical protein
VREILATVADITTAPRPALLAKYCRVNAAVELQREPTNTQDKNAIAVYLLGKGVFGLGKRRDHIGYIKAGTAKQMAPKIDTGTLRIERAFVRSFYLPESDDDERQPHVSLCLEVVDQ